MRLALLFITLFHASTALAQFWPMQQQQAGYAQVPGAYGYGGAGYGGYGYGGMPGYSVMPGQINQQYPWFRQPLPYFQQPNPSFGGWGGYGGFGQNQAGYGMFPTQPMSPFGMGMGSPFAMGGMGGSPFGGPRTNIGLNLNLNQLLGGTGNAFNGGSGGGWLDDGAPVCEECERRRRLERIRLSDDRDDYDPDYRTEARTRYVRQADDYPRNSESSPGVTLPPAAGPISGGERVADGGELPQVYRAPSTPGRQLPPAAAPRNSQAYQNFVDDPRPDIYIAYRISARDIDERRAQSAPIWNLFISNFMACVPRGCEPAQYASYGDRGHASCHQRGMAVDVHAIRCNGDPRLHRAIDQDPMFLAMVECMGGTPGNHVSRRGPMAVIWHQRTGQGPTVDHWDHAHFSPINGCTVPGGRMW